MTLNTQEGGTSTSKDFLSSLARSVKLLEENTLCEGPANNIRSAMENLRGLLLDLPKPEFNFYRDRYNTLATRYNQVLLTRQRRACVITA